MANATQAKWTDPTTNTDGTPITSGEVTGYQLGVRLASGVAGTYPYAATAPATATTELLSLLSPVLPTGVALIAAVQTLSTANGNSAWSVESASFTLVTPPNPPSALSVS